jgi:NADH:ubiquinone oxidoreductase subunit H
MKTNVFFHGSGVAGNPCMPLSDDAQDPSHRCSSDDRRTYLTYAERILAYMQVRIPQSRRLLRLARRLLTASATVQDCCAAPFNKFLFVLDASFTSALAAWAVVPFADGLVLANLNAGLLFIWR